MGQEGFEEDLVSVHAFKVGVLSSNFNVFV